MNLDLRTGASPRKRIGIALGSGSARGMAHIGVLQRLSELGVEPDIVCGTSIGSLIGACYVMDHLEHFTDWVQELSNTDIIRYMDVTLLGSGGMANGGRLMEFLREQYGDPDIESLDMPYAAIATDLYLGREIWLREGSLWDAVRASISVPGVLTPFAAGDRWLVDGALVNPVPISVCKAMGADLIIGVDLNSDLLGRPLGTERQRAAVEQVEQLAGAEITEEQDLIDSADKALDDNSEDQFSALERFTSSIKDAAANLWNSGSGKGAKRHPPGTINIMLNAINIMQDRITRSRLAGEPADLVFHPRLAHIGFMDFNQAADAIEEGRAAVDRMLPTLEFTLELHGLSHLLKKDAPASEARPAAEQAGATKAKEPLTEPPADNIPDPLKSGPAALAPASGGEEGAP